MIQFTRTSSAGGILELDGVKILLDGAGRPEVETVLPPVDIMAFTHNHYHHFSPEFVQEYVRQYVSTKLVGPKDVAADLPDLSVSAAISQAASVYVAALPSRHAGEAYQDTSHYSFLVNGSSRVWFLGDAAPSQWQAQERLPQPDLLIVPYTYAGDESVWQITEHFCPKNILLTHLPDHSDDPDSIWDMVSDVISHHPEHGVYLPEMGENIVIR